MDSEGKFMLLQPKNWGTFQHYKDRCPPWIKLHRDLLINREFMCLPLASKAIAPLLWLLACESKDGVFDASSDELQFRLHLSLKDINDGLKPLIDKGFFRIASGVLAECLQVATPERETEAERETETETKKNSNRGTRLPADLMLSTDWISFCRKERSDLFPEKVFEEFKDYWTAQPGQKGVKTDWDATWRNWVRRQNAPKNSEFSKAGQATQTVMSGLTRGLVGGGSNVKLLGI
jgi:hypothetical protein